MFYFYLKSQKDVEAELGLDPELSKIFVDCSFNKLALPGISYFSRWHEQIGFFFPKIKIK